MLRQPRLRRDVISYSPENGEGALLLAEGYREQSRNPLYNQLLPLLNGKHSFQQIVARLAPRFPLKDILDACYTLQKRGLLVDALAPEQDPFWEAHGLDGAALGGKTVAVRSIGGVPTEPFEAALTSAGLVGGAENPAVELALTDDYLRPELDSYNRRATRPWLLLRPVGLRIWLGPLFRPGETACWECLAQRMRLNRSMEQYLAHETGAFQPLPVPALAATLQLAALQAATQLAFWLAEGGSVLTDRLVVWDYATLEMQPHAVVRRPQCPVCGDPGPHEPQPVVLRGDLALASGDAGYRSVAAEATFERYKHHVSPISGVAGYLRSIPGGDGIFVYGARNNAQARIASWEQLERAERYSAGGKGSSDSQAKVSALCEALERYSSHRFGDEAVVMSSYAELGPRAQHPGPILNFSAAQYADRLAYNRRARVNRVPHPFDERASIPWTKVWSLTRQTWKYVPTGICYFGVHDDEEDYFFRGDSNGNAAGSSLEDAILQGFLELVERDSAAIWWFNRLPRAGVALEGIDDSLVEAMQHYYATLQREFWLLDLTADLGIPTFVALSRRTDSVDGQFCHGLGTHFNPRIAAIRALTELNQLLPRSLAHAEREDRRVLQQDELGYTLAGANLATEGCYLLPAPDLPLKRITDYAAPEFTDLGATLEYCLGKVQQIGSEMLVHNLTRPDVGLPVVKVIVPTMRHFWRRLAPGRLYDVPEKLGWLAAPRHEDELNPRDLVL